MNKRYIIPLLCIALCWLTTGGTHAQYADFEEQVVVKSVVTDQDGKPIPGATVYANEGDVWTTTDTAGQFALTVTGLSDILIEAPGYEPRVFSPEERLYILDKMEFLFGSGDRLHVAFGRRHRGSTANAISVLKPDDIRGYDNTQTVTSMMYGRLPGLYGANNLRGMGQVLFVVDGLPRDPSFINISEVEEITFLKDVNSSVLYGNSAVNGVMLITTKRGEAYKRNINVQAYYGISEPRALPKYLSSADYMEQYNVARLNDGMTIMYDESMIENYRSGNPYRYPNIDYYSNDYLNKIKPFARVQMDVSGGNDIATYYSHLAWENEGSLIGFGAGNKSHSNGFSARGNVDLKVSRKIRTSVDAVGYINHNKQPNITDANNNLYSYWERAAVLRPDRYTPLIPINLVDPNLPLLGGLKNDIGGKYIVGGNSSNQYNPIAGVYLGGDNTLVTRNFSFNNRIDFDLGDWLEGLAFHTNISFDYLNVYNESLRNSYAVYEAAWHPTEDRIIGLTKFNEDNKSGTRNVSNIYGRRRFGAYAMLDYHRTFDGVHHVDGTILAYTSHDKLTSNLQTDKNTNMGLRLAYNYANRYLVDFSSSIVNSAKLHPDNRTGFSPSLGLGWVMSSEEFMSSVGFIDFLKFKVSGGIMKSDARIGDYYLYDDRYTNAGGFSWYDGKVRYSTIPSFGENRRLSFEKRQDVNVGLEGIFMNKSLSLEVNFFKSFHADIVTKATSEYPSYFSAYSPYQNYNKNEYRGFEAGLEYSRTFGQVGVMVGGTVLYADSKVVKADEIWGNPYQYRRGNPVNGAYVLISEGFFMSQEEIDSHPVQSWGTVKPGDIKYRDQNDDGIIDSNDEVFAGRWTAPWSYNLYFKVSYRNFTLFALGTGRAGGIGYLGDGGFNNYYWAQGDVKYSTFMLNNWTEETKHTATYPRLSTTANNNNFRGSTFWIYKSDYFDLSRVQLTYDLNFRSMNKMHLKNVSVFCLAENILTISKYKHVKNLSIGSEPQYRNYKLGVKMAF